MDKKRFFFSKHSFLTMLVLLGAVLGVLFFRSLLPGWVHFNNDGPLGLQAAAPYQLPQAFSGVWVDLNTIGTRGGTPAASSPTYLLKWAVGPRWFLNLYPVAALLVLGCGAWFFFRQLKLSQLAAVLGGLATALTTPFFSGACWGVASQQFAIGFDLIALGLAISALHGSRPLLRWAQVALAGFAVGINIVEGADIGAILSVLVAIYIVYHSVISCGGSLPQRLSGGVLKVSVIALCAAWLASGVVLELVGTQIKGVAGMSSETKGQHWDWATQWSLPKRELLSAVIPGLFGYRMDTPEGGNYWGAMGRDPAWDRYFASDKQGPAPQGYMRLSGGGNYVGVFVVLIALWTAFQAFRKNSVFSLTERRLLWFWVGAGILSTLLAFGRFAPFYQVVYHLPYFSTIRNPAKFVIIFTWSVIVLFTYGIHALTVRCLEIPATSASTFGARWRAWWSRAAAFDKRWVMGSMGAVALSLVGWLIYRSSRSSLEQYLQTVQFDESMARAIAEFSVRQVGWFILFLVLSVGLMLLMLSGVFAGRRAKWGGILLGLVLVADLARANLPWIVYQDYQQKYASNPIVDFFRNKPYEHRVAILPFRSPPQFSTFEQLYRIEWAQHHFQYYNIQSLDIVQMPRMAQDLQNYESALGFRGTPDSTYLLTRRWALTNTRYLLGPAGFLDVLNEQIDPEQRRFRIAQTFNVMPKPGILNPTRLEELTAEPAGDKGQYAVFEFTGALPRASLYSNWQVPARDAAMLAALKAQPLGTNELDMLKSVGTNDFLTLETLASPKFDPRKTVLVADAVPLPSSTNAPGQQPGTVEYTSYSPKDIKLKARASAASVLLLNDKYDPNWQVSVDGKRAELLRCNYIMRGVYLPPGEHAVEFTFRPDIRPMYVSLAAIALGLCLLGFVVISGRKAQAGKTSA